MRQKIFHQQACSLHVDGEAPHLVLDSVTYTGPMKHLSASRTGLPFAARTTFQLDTGLAGAATIRHISELHGLQ